MEILRLHFGQLPQGFEESEAGDHDQIEVQFLNDFGFHLDYLLLGECLSCKMDEVIELGDLISFLVFGCDEKRCSPHKLKFIFGYFPLAQEPIYDHGDGVEGFREHFKFVMQVIEPIQEDAPHFLSYFGFSGNIIMELVLAFLMAEHVSQALIEVGWDHLIVLNFRFLWQFGDEGLVLRDGVKKFLMDVFVGIINADASGLGLIPADIAFLVNDRWLENVGEFLPKESIHGAM